MLCLITPHAQHEQGKVSSVCVHVCLWTKTILNRTLEIDSLALNKSLCSSRQKTHWTGSKE